MRHAGLWRQPDFLKLWAGQAISQIGSRITREGLPLTAVLLLGASPLQMGILSGFAAAAVLVFGLFAGAWADRLRRRPILITTDLLRAAMLGTIPLAAVLHTLTMGHLYLVAAVSSILTVLFDVSYQAYLPSLVDRANLLEGNAKLALTESIAEVAGPGLTGILVQWITAPMAILFDAVSFLVSALSLGMIRKREPLPARDGQHPHMLREIADGLRASWRNPSLRALGNRIAMAAFFMGFFSSLYIVFAIRDLRINAALLGVIISVGGASSLLGALFADRLARRFGFGRTFIASALLTGLAGLLVPMAHGPVALCALFLGASQLFDIGWPVYNISQLSLIQATTPDHLLGRVNSAMHLLFRGLMPVGAFAGGVIAEHAGIRTTLYVGSTGILISTLWLVFSPIRNMRVLPDTSPADRDGSSTFAAGL